MTRTVVTAAAATRIGCNNGSDGVDSDKNGGGDSGGGGGETAVTMIVAITTTTTSNSYRSGSKGDGSSGGR